MNKINEKDRLIGGPFLTSLLLFLVFDTVYAYGHTLLMNSSIVFFSKTKIMLVNIAWHCVVFLICVWFTNPMKRTGRLIEIAIIGIIICIAEAYIQLYLVAGIIAFCIHLVMAIALMLSIFFSGIRCEGAFLNFKKSEKVETGKFVFRIAMDISIAIVSVIGVMLSILWTGGGFPDTYELKLASAIQIIIGTLAVCFQLQIWIGWPAYKIISKNISGGHEL